jgi:hypothetical protein
MPRPQRSGFRSARAILQQIEVVTIACRPYAVDSQFGATDHRGFAP